MKFVFNFLLLIILNCQHLFSQGYDNLWMMGMVNRGINIDFTSGIPLVSATNCRLRFGPTNAVICDKDGNFQFCTNGISVVNSQNKVMMNGNVMCNDWLSLSYSMVGIPFVQGALILPKDSTTYYLFHIEMDSVVINPVDFYYSIIDMSRDSGRGEVITKSAVLFSDTLTAGYITACRHGNGRDWWLIVPKATSNTYYTILFSPVLYPPRHLTYYTQQIGLQTSNDINNGAGQCAFSPDGSKYARIDPQNGLSLYEFDRCRGLFSNDQHLDTNAFGSNVGCTGVAFSPNSRFLYVSYHLRFYQIDTWQPLTTSSPQLIATYEGFSSPGPTTFFTSQLARDGKIYTCSNFGADKLHVINYPDSSGIACDLQQHSLLLPYNNVWTMATPPFFSLGKLAGSPCDTLIDEVNELESVSMYIFPNPSTGKLRAVIPQDFKPRTARIFDNLSRLVIEQKVSFSSKEIIFNVEKLKEGIYYMILDNGERSVYARFVKE